MVEPKVIWRDRVWNVAQTQGGSIVVAPLAGATRGAVVAFDDPLLVMDPDDATLRGYCTGCGRHLDGSTRRLCGGCRGWSHADDYGKYDGTTPESMAAIQRDLK